jgi:hypothetical protein
MQQFKQRVLAAPSTLPIKLKVGQSTTPGHPLQPIREISDAFGNLDRVAYHRRRIIKDSTVISKLARQNSDIFISEICRFQDEHSDFIQHVVLVKKVVIILQTKWMRSQLKELVRDDSRNNLGILTDTTYKYFRGGFLMTSSVYSLTLRRWIPILLSFIRKEDEEHMKEHFRYLIECSQADMSSDQFSKVIDQVVDFSMAEHNAFVRGYIEVKINDRLHVKEPMSEYLQAANERELIVEAETHLKGCEQHYRYDSPS